jgi:hypothetical protein
LPLEDLDDELMAAYRDNQLEIWKSAIVERFDSNIEKTRLVHYAQRTLAAGMVVALPQILFCRLALTFVL